MVRRQRPFLSAAHASEPVVSLKPHPLSTRKGVSNGTFCGPSSVCVLQCFIWMLFPPSVMHHPIVRNTSGQQTALLCFASRNKVAPLYVGALSVRPHIALGTRALVINTHVTS